MRLSERTRTRLVLLNLAMWFLGGIAVLALLDGPRGAVETYLKPVENELGGWLGLALGAAGWDDLPLPRYELAIEPRVLRAAALLGRDGGSSPSKPADRWWFPAHFRADGAVYPVDLQLEGGDGLDLVKDLKQRHPALPALVLSMHDESVYAERALRAGARGYVTKQQLDETVLAAIRRLLAGETWMSPELEAQLAQQFLGGRTLQGGSPLDALSDRELEVFRWIGRGRSTRQIAESLHLSVKTIESHREHIRDKLAVESAAELVRRAIRWVESGRAG